MKRLASLLLATLTAGTLAAQQSHWEASVGGEYMLTAYSFKSPHNSLAAAADIAWWQQAEGYSYGLKAGLNINPDGICGHRAGVLGMLRLPLGNLLDADMGLGLSTYTSPLPLTGNDEDVYISTWLTFMFDMGLNMWMTEQLRLGLHLTHSSNGHLNRPNRGLNFFRLEAGYSFGEKDRMPARAFSTNKDWVESAHRVGITASGGLTASRHMMQKGLFPCYDLSLNYQYLLAKRSMCGLTVDLWYNFSHPWQLPRYHDNYTAPVYLGVMFVLEQTLGPLSIRGGIGYTLLHSTLVKRPVYERLSLYYNLKHHYFGLGINAHVGQAEFVEWSYGFWLPVG